MATTTTDSQSILDGTKIDSEVFKLRPDYRAYLLIVDNIPPGPSDADSEALLAAAESSAKAALAKQAVTDIPHIAAWREAYKAFGAKPAKFRNSVEALTRRVDGGLPRVNRLTDIYNAVSVKYSTPVGGEDLDKYEGLPVLIRATGQENFVTSAGGQPVTEHPDKGEVVWCDEGGVTCRRWNWRQCSRTALTDETTRVLFILDALDPLTDETLEAAANELASALQKLSSDVKVVRRAIRAS